MNTFNKVLTASSIGILLFTSIGTADSYFEGWTFIMDQQGNVVKMVLDNPHTPLGIEKKLTIEINPDLTVRGGRVELRNGIDAGSGRLEADTYWELCNGPHVLWDYYESIGKLVTLSPNDKIPQDWFGKTVRFVSRSNAEVFGTLSFTNDAERFSINAEQYMVPGACCGHIVFTTATVIKLQTLR